MPIALHAWTLSPPSLTHIPRPLSTRALAHPTPHRAHGEGWGLQSTRRPPASSPTPPPHTPRARSSGHAGLRPISKPWSTLSIPAFRIQHSQKSPRKPSLTHNTLGPQPLTYHSAPENSGLPCPGPVFRSTDGLSPGRVQGGHQDLHELQTACQQGSCAHFPGKKGQASRRHSEETVTRKGQS